MEEILSFERGMHIQDKAMASFCYDSPRASVLRVEARGWCWGGESFLADVNRVTDSEVYLPALLVGLEFHRGLGLQRGASSQVLYGLGLDDYLQRLLFLICCQIQLREGQRERVSRISSQRDLQRSHANRRVLCDVIGEV